MIRYLAVLVFAAGAARAESAVPIFTPPASTPASALTPEPLEPEKIASETLVRAYDSPFLSEDVDAETTHEGRAARIFQRLNENDRWR